MPQKLKEVDVVVIGIGFAGSDPAKELAVSGLKVVGLERGQGRHTVPDFQVPAIHDELKYSIRKGMMQDVTREAMTFRNHYREDALPMRQWEAFLPGTGLGGCGVHWNGQSWRYHEEEFDQQDTHRAALRKEDSGPGSSNSRLGRDLPGTGALLRPLRISPRRLWQSRKFERQDRAG